MPVAVIKSLLEMPLFPSWHNIVTVHYCAKRRNLIYFGYYVSALFAGQYQRRSCRNRLTTTVLPAIKIFVARKMPSKVDWLVP